MLKLLLCLFVIWLDIGAITAVFFYCYDLIKEHTNENDNVKE